jgi:hypothetical protein
MVRPPQRRHIRSGAFKKHPRRLSTASKNLRGGRPDLHIWFQPGAYTARSLVGLIRNAGLLKPAFFKVVVV